MSLFPIWSKKMLEKTENASENVSKLGGPVNNSLSRKNMVNSETSMFISNHIAWEVKGCFPRST